MPEVRLFQSDLACDVLVLCLGAFRLTTLPTLPVDATATHMVDNFLCGLTSIERKCVLYMRVCVCLCVWNGHILIYLCRRPLLSNSHSKEIQFKIDTRNTKAIPIICSVHEIGFDNFMGNLSELKFIYIRFICSSWARFASSVDTRAGDGGGGGGTYNCSIYCSRVLLHSMLGFVILHRQHDDVVCIVCGVWGLCGVGPAAVVFTLGRLYFYLIKAKLSYATFEFPEASIGGAWIQNEARDEKQKKEVLENWICAVNYVSCCCEKCKSN